MSAFWTTSRLSDAWAVVVRVFKPKVPAISLDGPESPLHTTADPDAAGEDHAQKKTPVPSFDLAVTRGVLLLETAVYILVFFAASPRQWLVSTMGIALGGSLSPSLTSLALAISPGGDTAAGALFGAFSVLLSLGSVVPRPVMRC